jgi:hypothetical protein
MGVFETAMWALILATIWGSAAWTISGRIWQTEGPSGER